MFFFSFVANVNIAMGPSLNNYGDCQVPIVFEASRLRQTESEMTSHWLRRVEAWGWAGGGMVGGDVNIEVTVNKLPWENSENC